MRVFIFTFLLCFFTTTRLCALTFLCTNRADYACKVLNWQDTSITFAKTCDQIKSISQDTILYYSYDLIKKCNSWNTDITKNKDCPYVTYEHIDDDNGEGKNFVFFCITNPNILVAYTDEATTSWSYDQKKCVGSGGTWTNDTCDCTKLPGTTTVENECLCTGNENQQYFGKLWSGCNTLADGVKAPNGHTTISGYGDYNLQSIDKINSCSPSGGTWLGPKDNTCLCNGENNLELHTSGYFCKCKDGTHYTDPLQKYRGCTEQTNIAISGTVVNNTNNTALNGVRVFVANDESITTTTDTFGKYTLTVPNNADITFALSGYKPQTISATYLETANTPISLLPDEIADHEITETHPDDTDGQPSPENADDTCEKSGGIPQGGGTCTCNAADNLIQNTDKTKCVCADGFTREKDGDKCEQIKNQPGQSGKQTSEQDKLKSAQDALTKAKEAENSWANRAVTAASTAATGIGAMTAASALAEQNADADAERDMRAYIETMKCEYGGGQIVTMGNEDVTLPGGNELLTSYREYKQLADNLKTTKSALGLRSGIESEVLYDRAQSGLYQYASVGKTGGAETSVYRALTDTDSADALAWAEQKESTAKQLKTGAIVAGAGVATGVIGNYLVNERGNKTEELKREFQQVEKETEFEFPLFILTISDTKGSGSTNPQPEIKEQNNLGTELSKLSFVTDKGLFEPGEYTLKNTNVLNEWANKISEILNKDAYKNSKICITANGHTDRTIPAKKSGRDYTTNEQLSQKRADAVIKHLKDSSSLKSFISKTYSYGYGAKNCTENKYADKAAPECRYVSVTVTDCTTELSQKMAPVMGGLIDKIDFNQLLTGNKSQ